MVTENIREIIAPRLRALREESGKAQNKVAEDLGITPSVLAGYESSSPSAFREPPLARLIKLADYYEVSVDFLLGRIEQKRLEYVDVGERTGLDDGAIRFLEENKRLYADTISALLASDVTRYLLQAMTRYATTDFDLVNNLLEEFSDEAIKSISVSGNPEFSEVEEWGKRTTLAHKRLGTERYCMNEIISYIEVITKAYRDQKEPERKRTKEFYESDEYKHYYQSDEYMHDMLEEEERQKEAVEAEEQERGKG